MGRFADAVLKVPPWSEEEVPYWHQTYIGPDNQSQFCLTNMRKTAQVSLSSPGWLNIYIYSLITNSVCVSSYIVLATAFDSLSDLSAPIFVKNLVLQTNWNINKWGLQSLGKAW